MRDFKFKCRCLTAFVLSLGLADLGRAQPIILTPPQDQTNIVDTTASLSVGATDAVPLSYQWMFGSPATNVAGATDATLTITNVQLSNQGPYQVVLSDTQLSS